MGSHSTRSGTTFVVDDNDDSLVRSLAWWINTVGRTSYVRSRGGYLHRLILGAQAGELVDHRDGDGTNNHRANLRLTTRQLNAANMGPRCGRTLKGVSLNPTTRRWRAQITVGGRARHLGYFASAEEAASAYDGAAFDAWGTHARLNSRG